MSTSSNIARAKAILPSVAVTVGALTVSIIAAVTVTVVAVKEAMHVAVLCGILCEFLVCVLT